jgi:hypothetical protein
MRTFEPNTEAPVPPKVSKAISSEAATPDTEPVTIAGVLHVPDSPLSLEEIHSILWYTFTTTISPDKLAELFNSFFAPAQPIDRWIIADTVNVLETRWEANGKTLGEGFRLRRPTAYGSCPCDFDIDCVDVKRTSKTRQNQKYLTIAASLWDQSAVELVLCPRGNRKDNRHPPPVQTAARQASLFIAHATLLAILHDTWHHARLPARTALTFTLWLSTLHLWFASCDSLTFPIQRTLSSHLHRHPSTILAVLHCVFEGFLDGFPTFSHLRAMPFGELALQAVTRLVQMEIAIGIALVLCSVLGMLPDGVPMKPAWDSLGRWLSRSVDAILS